MMVLNFKALTFMKDLVLIIQTPLAALEMTQCLDFSVQIVHNPLGHICFTNHRVDIIGSKIIAPTLCRKISKGKSLQIIVTF